MEVINQFHGKNFSLYHGDCVEVIKPFPDNCFDFGIHSPPFSNLYIYSDSYRDMGNCKDDEEFFQNYGYLIPELLRTTKPGRLCAVHCKQMPKYKSRDGVTGLKDFRGDIIRAFEKAIWGNAKWVYHSEVCIWTDPVQEMQRTKTQRLLYSQLKKDASLSGIGVAEYLVLFRKWTDDYENSDPVKHAEDDIPLEMWQRYASPVWFDIQRTDVLNVKIARDNPDEKHLAPLQLGVIERAVHIWTNPGEVVFTPFAGIGSEVYQAVKMGRKGVGIELKESYFKQAVENCKEAEITHCQMSIFEEVAI